MSGQIIPVEMITASARQAAEAGQPVGACPYQAGTDHANRRQIAYWLRERELRAEVEP